MMSFSSRGSVFLVLCIVLVLCPAPTLAFGAGNIPGISTVEGQNWRHGDIEDMLKTVAFLKGHKWTTMMIKRVYFGNWLRDYSQAVDVGSLKGVPAPTIRILVWILGFLSFGYATREFEVTEERLGVYRPEEHIDNPKDYADNMDARQFDPRLRGPVQREELEVDLSTGMKNYIANDRGGWATSTGYVRYSITRSIHFGRVYTHGSGGTSGKEQDLCEALRCLGQALHCLEDFGAHTNYTELALIELGFHEVFPHVGSATQINLNGRHVYPLTTGTFGAVDFLHSVLGEATDHFTQSEVDEMDVALLNAQISTKNGGSDGTRGFFGSSAGGSGDDFLGLLSQIPGQGSALASQARDLQAQSQAQEYENESSRASGNPPSFQGPPGSTGGPPSPGIPGMNPNFDAAKAIARIYPILEFRDSIVRSINNTIAKIPGLEKLVETISEKITVFIMSLLAPFVRPIIEQVSKSLKDGSSAVVKSSADQQFIPWNDPHSSDPTHSMLSKDHFSNYLNSVAGRVAATVLQYAAPRVIYAWEHPGIPVDEVINDILRVFHHPAARNESLEIHRNMFNTVRKWVDENPNRGSIGQILSSASVKAGHNHKGGSNPSVHSHGADNSHNAFGGYGQAAGAVWEKIQKRDLGAMRDIDSPDRMASPNPGGPAGGGFGYTSIPGTPSPAPYGGNDSYGSYQNQNQGGGGGYQAPPDQYQGSGYGGGYGSAPQPAYGEQQPPYGAYPPQQTGWEQGPPPPQGGWQQGPPPPQDGGWQQGPPPQQGGGWQQGPPPQQGGWGQQPPPGQYPGQGYPGQGYSGGGY